MGEVAREAAELAHGAPQRLEVVERHVLPAALARGVAAVVAAAEDVAAGGVAEVDVAGDAGVTVQTVLRRFSGKQGLLDALMSYDRMAHYRERASGDDPAALVRAVIEDYELGGDFVIRLLAQEDRYPALKQVADFGRQEHRAWIERAFAANLQGLSPSQARKRVDRLVVALDLYVWKLVRRDMGRPVAELQDMMERLVAAALKDAVFEGEDHHAEA